MARGNNINLQGKIVKEDAQIRQAGNNHIASFGIVWQQSKKNKAGEWENVPNFFNCKAWLSEKQVQSIGSKLTKGSTVSITDAHLAYESWEAKDGSKRSSVVIQIDDVYNGLLILPPKNQQPMQSKQSSGEYYDDVPVDVYDADIPF